MKLFDKNGTITDTQADGMTEIMIETVKKLQKYCNEEGLAFTPALWAMGTVMRDAAKGIMKEENNDDT